MLVPLPAPSEPPPVPESFTVVATGDVLVHPALTAQALADSATGEPDFGPLLAGVAPAVSAADLALCHLEVPLAEPDGPFAGYPSFDAPPQV
ncbi:MAG: CapA family protein, partial [Actinomycetota bacterium]|nr:CapA family protein [Actinomycetota bacterium]